MNSFLLYSEMRKRVLLIFLCAFLCANYCLSAVYAPKDVPLVYLQDSTRFVSNPDAILSDSTVAEMDSILHALKMKTGIETVVVAVDSIDGGDCFDFAQQLAKISGAGQKKRDNGLVILLSTGERCIQFATGYGLEGALPDAICKRIQTKYMLPHFKDDNWSAGMLEGIRATSAHLDGSMENIEDASDDDGILYFISACMAFGFGLVGFAVWWGKRCPNCKKHKLRRVSSKVISINKKTGVNTIETVMECSNCGHIKKTLFKVGGNDSGSSSGSRSRSGSTFTGGFGGGSSRGGSFGGGSFGGGGAGSRF